MEIRTRPVDDERCPVCGSAVLEYYAATEMTGQPDRTERVLGHSCGDPSCRWQEFR